MHKQSVAVIGGGMAGLSAAYNLQKLGLNATVFERESNVGGRTRSLHVNGYHLDLGAITLTPAYHHTIEMMRELGAGDVLIPREAVMGIVRDNKVHELDLSKPLRSFAMSKLLSNRAKLSLVRIVPTLLRYGSKCQFENMAELEELDIENCQSFALRKLGQELHDYLVDPIIRVNMFNSTSMSSAVDLIWLMKIFSDAKLVQIKGGMGEMSKKIASRLEVRLDSCVDAVVIEGNGVTINQSGNEPERFDGAIIATPPPIAMTIAPWISGPLRGWYEKVHGVKSMTVHVGLSRIPESRAAMIMTPTCAAEDVLGIVLEHNKCPERTPEGNSLITLHMTEAWAQGQQDLDDETIAKNALSCVAPFLGDFSNDIDMVNIHRWDYVDHDRYVGAYKALGEVIPQMREGRVQFSGEYISAGIEGAVISGARCAESISRYLRS